MTTPETPDTAPHPDPMSDGTPMGAHLPGIQALRAASERIVARWQILERLDVARWRVPANGLLEYDVVHDEWRVELTRRDGRSVIVRRRAGRRPVDLTAYLAGDTSGVRVSWVPGGFADPAAPTLAELGYPPMAVATRPRDWAPGAGALAKAGAAGARFADILRKQAATRMHRGG